MSAVQALLQKVQLPWTTRFLGALLALGIATAHVNDQGGITAFVDDPAWLGWGYRIIEVTGVLTAAVLLLGGSVRLAWVPAFGLGLFPFIGYVLTRTVGLPGDHEDVGNWGEWSGTMALLFEASMVVLALSLLLPALQQLRARASAPALAASR